MTDFKEQHFQGAKKYLFPGGFLLLCVCMTLLYGVVTNSSTGLKWLGQVFSYQQDTTQETLAFELKGLTEAPSNEVYYKFYVAQTDGNPILLRVANLSQANEWVKRTQQGSLNEWVAVRTRYVERLGTSLGDPIQLDAQVAAQFPNLDTRFDMEVLDFNNRMSSFIELSVVLGVIASYLMWRGIRIVLRNKRAYKTLYQHYPELVHHIERLPEAGYHDERLKLIVYGHHIISYHKGMTAVDMSDIYKYYLSEQEGSWYGRRATLGCSLIMWLNNRKTKVMMHLPVSTAEAKERYTDLASVIQEVMEG